MPKRNEIIKRLKETLDSDRFEHSLRVEKIALQLGKRHRVAPKNISLAALLHDCARRYSRPALLRRAKKLGLPIDPVSRSEPKLFHGAIGAHLARTEFGVSSPAVLRAIRHHTTGAPRMSRLEKIIYLADHLEIGRDYPEVEKLRRLAYQDLDRAIIASTAALLKFLIKAGLPIHPATISTRNSFINKK